MKKGQGLSLNTIIIAAIVLIVLIVLWAIFTGRMGTFTTETKAKTEGEECPAENWKDACDPGETIVIASNAEGHPGKVCCKDV